MIIQLQSGTAENTEAARENLQTLAHSWGQDLQEVPVHPSAGSLRDDDKVIDPISLTALVLSIPSAALAVLDLADRIKKRRRAKELIDHAQRLADEQVSVLVLSRSGPVDLTTLDPDQLLDVQATESPTS